MKFLNVSFMILISRLLFGRHGIYCKCLNACPISFHRQVIIDGAPSFKTKLARSSYTSQVGQRKVAVAGSHHVHGYGTRVVIRLVQKSSLGPRLRVLYTLW